MLYDWLRIKQKAKHRSEHMHRNQKQMDIHPTLPNTLGKYYI